VTSNTDVLRSLCYAYAGKGVKDMQSLKYGSEGLAEKEKDPQFLACLQKLKDRAIRRPYDFRTHEMLSKLYISKNMFAEAEFEQEIMEWLDRIRRSVKLNNG